MEKIFQKLSLSSASVVFVILIGIFITLFNSSKLAIDEFGFNFLVNPDWNKEVVIGSTVLESDEIFDEDKIIIIKRATDKIVKLIDELNTKNIEETVIIIISDNLDKKSNLRSLFEKEKNFICVAFYPDTNQTLSKITHNFLNEKKY